MSNKSKIFQNNLVESDKPQSVLLSTAYLPPISYFVAILNAEDISVETHENYIKQTYRNRCKIAAANGLMNLNLPIEKAQYGKNQIKDIRIANHDNWQKQHWRSITSAYNTSSFFEYYEDDFRPFYEKEWKYLYDYNQEILMLLLNLLDIEKSIQNTDDFLMTYTDKMDLREAIHPKKNIIVDIPEYYQVFQLKNGFQEDLSIIDLLFNMGNEAILVLLKSKFKVDFIKNN